MPLHIPPRWLPWRRGVQSARVWREAARRTQMAEQAAYDEAVRRMLRLARQDGRL